MRKRSLLRHPCPSTSLWLEQASENRQPVSDGLRVLRIRSQGLCPLLEDLVSLTGIDILEVASEAGLQGGLGGFSRVGFLEPPFKRGCKGRSPCRGAWGVAPQLLFSSLACFAAGETGK